MPLWSDLMHRLTWTLCHHTWAPRGGRQRRPVHRRSLPSAAQRVWLAGHSLWPVAGCNYINTIKILYFCTSATIVWDRFLWCVCACVCRGRGHVNGMGWFVYASVCVWAHVCFWVSVYVCVYVRARACVCVCVDTYSKGLKLKWFPSMFEPLEYGTTLKIW